MKYVIRNCGCNPACDECYTRCKDITDCLLKRIAKLCKDEECEFADEILELLEIEEVDA